MLKLNASTAKPMPLKSNASTAKPMPLKSNASTAKPMPFALSHTLAHTSGTISPKTSGTLLLFLSAKNKFKTFLFSEYFS